MCIPYEVEDIDEAADTTPVILFTIIGCSINSLSGIK